jgi:hypothetical protein
MNIGMNEPAKGRICHAPYPGQTDPLDVSKNDCSGRDGDEKREVRDTSGGGGGARTVFWWGQGNGCEVREGKVNV